jgi:hypothetical protein
MPAPASVHPAASDETAMAEAASEPADAFDANDEAMLDMVAMEMAAPDSDAAYDPTIEEHQDHEMQVADAQALASCDETISESVAAYEIEVTFPDSSEQADEPVAATALPVVTPLQSVPKPAVEPETVKPEPALPASLGSSLLANGIVTRPRASRPDPLAPIRRMSQTEKIAFFS